MMTKSAQALMWDKEFVEKRIQEQETALEDYIYPRHYYTGRALELYDSMMCVLTRFKRQLENINKLQ